jgi:hypothetical protein
MLSRSAEEWTDRTESQHQPKRDVIVWGRGGEREAGEVEVDCTNQPSSPRSSLRLVYFVVEIACLDTAAPTAVTYVAPMSIALARHTTRSVCHFFFWLLENLFYNRMPSATCTRQTLTTRAEMGPRMSTRPDLKPSGHTLSQNEYQA